jgi:histidine ammonia-lyase
MTVILTGEDLTIDEVVRVAREGERVELAGDVAERVRRGRGVVQAALVRGDAVYGLTTGVGVHKQSSPDPSDPAAFNLRLIEGHRVGQGSPYPPEVVRAAMTRLANGFAKGTSGARLELLERVLARLNAGGAPPPEVRMLGSLGEADLPANADLAAALVEGFELAANEGLSLLGHNAFSTGHAAVAVADARRLLDSLDVSGALDLEAFAANLSILHPAVAQTRPYPGLAESLQRLRTLLEGSFLWEDGAARNLQDPLSFRTLPQVHGAARDALAYTERQLSVELNASQENPLVVVDEERLISTGQFEVLPLAAALDFLRIGLVPALGTAAERTVKLLQSMHTGLPDGLAPRSGLADSALSELAVPAQSLAAEARLLAQPVSFELGSATHHGGIEDRATLAPLGARRLAEMVSLGERLVAIELVVAAQAIDLRGRPALGAGTAPVYASLRELVPFTGEHEAPPDVEALLGLVRGPAREGRDRDE